MYNSEILNALPKMLTKDELISEMTILPEYNPEICNENEAIRLMALSDLYNIYLPSQMSQEIYSKLYLALLRSLQKKTTNTTVRQQNENYKAIKQKEYSGILGGSDSFTIIGTSGIGKSSAISRAVNLITDKGIIETENTYSKIIPCITVQCPFDSSVKGLLLEILRKIDEELGSNYHQNAIRAKATVDILIGSVSQVAINHIGLLIVDEIQNVVNSKNGKSLIGSLTQLINNSGISICMVGTPESEIFFEQAMQLARRSLGLRYDRLEYNQYFYDFCSTLYEYQYVKNKTYIDSNIVEWLYEHSGGVISIVVSLIHDAQEIAILNSKEVLNIETLNEAYLQRATMLHKFIEPERKKTKSVKPKPQTFELEEQEVESEFTIADLVNVSKTNNIDIVHILKQYVSVTEVVI